MAAAIVSWWHVVQADYQNVQDDVTLISDDASSLDSRSLSADCGSLVIDVAMLQRDPPFPTTDGNTHWQNALRDFAMGGAECTSAAAVMDATGLEVASTDFINGTSELDQVTALVRQIGGL